MNIEKRKAGKKRKYYLAHSIRIAGKVKKIRVYLGTNKKDVDKKLPQAEKIVQQKIQALTKINDPLKHVITPEELKQIRTLIAKGKIRIPHLNEDEWLLFTEAFTYDTNAIEGSIVTSKEVKEILEKNKWPEERRKWEISETYGVSEAINYIRKTKIHISIELIKELHKIVFKNSKPFAGKLRKKGEEVVIMDSIGNIIHRGAPYNQIIPLLTELIKWYEKNKNKYHAILLAAVVHNQFENIHPFRDGNGRVGRLLLNNILLKHGKPPVNIELKNRKQYYSALQAYQKDGNIRPTIELILKEYRKLDNLLRARAKR